MRKQLVDIKGTYLPDACHVKAASFAANGLGGCLRAVRWMGGSSPLDLLDLQGDGAEILDVQASIIARPSLLKFGGEALHCDNTYQTASY